MAQRLLKGGGELQQTGYERVDDARVFEEMNEVGLGGFLEGEDCGALPTKRSSVACFRHHVHSNLSHLGREYTSLSCGNVLRDGRTYDAGKWEFAQEKVGTALVFADLA